MRQDRWLNPERGVFLAMLALCAWQAWAYLFEQPVPVFIPKPMAQDPLPVKNLPPIPRPEPFETYINRGRDVFVPSALTGFVQERQRPQDRLPGGDPNAPNSQAPGLVLWVDLPPKPEEFSKHAPAPVQPAATPGEEKLPLTVRGWLAVKPGEPRKILVLEPEDNRYFTMGLEEEWNGIKVVALTAESVIFENEKGKRFFVHKDMLAHPEGAGTPPGAGTAPRP
ncbi:MAG: hypothetical protein V1918_00865 [Planctomycetota bacterium]